MTPKQYIRSFLTDPLQIFDAHKSKCNLCSYHGRFWSFGVPARKYSRCPNCSSLERHRLYGVMMDERKNMMDGKAVLHFAPETQIKDLFLKQKPEKYVTADIEPGVAETVEDMTQLTITDESYDIAVANHVLEHIPADDKAFSEIFRVLKKGGEFWAAVPIIEGWNNTYENDNVDGEKNRILHFGQHNHVRFYGRDFVTRFEKAGFKVERFQAPPQKCVELSLGFGETVFVGKKV